MATHEEINLMLLPVRDSTCTGAGQGTWAGAQQALVQVTVRHLPKELRRSNGSAVRAQTNRHYQVHYLPRLAVDK